MGTVEVIERQSEGERPISSVCEITARLAGNILTRKTRNRLIRIQFQFELMARCIIVFHDRKFTTGPRPICDATGLHLAGSDPNFRICVSGTNN